jgi:FtsP/CotA-like multicopper oxidase with cupredoxin domain
MKTSLFILLVLASKASLAFDKVQANFNTKFPRSAADVDLCKNTPTSRNCWGEYNIDTNYYTTFPDGGKTVEIWLSVEEAICNQDGYKRSCMTFNGTMPGPPIVADWGDDLIIHVTNRMELNGTAIHWHGVRQLGTVEYDGVPGVTQCPIMPGDTLTYRFKVTQYGTSWYHSHFSLQYAEGLFGPLIFNGPSTADYDIDLGPVVLQDWSHKPIFTSWAARVKWGLTHSLNNLLINGMNTFDCDASTDTNCVGGGKKFELVLEPGKKHRLRLINVSIDSAFQFSIDNHKLTVIGNDFVALEPFEVDSILLSSGQRYDVLVEANATPGDYWMRGGWVKTCQGAANDHPDDMTGIVRYDASSTSFPTSISTIPESKTCVDEPTESLVPHLKLDVGKFASTTVEDVNVRLSHTAILQWTINSSSLYLDWNQPTLKKIFDGAKLPLEYNVVEVDVSATTCETHADMKSLTLSLETC